MIWDDDGGAVEEKLYVEDVFSAYAAPGVGANGIIANGVDTTKGALVWGKARNDTQPPYLFDTVRGGNQALFSNSASEQYNPGATYLTARSDGFQTGPSSAAWNSTALSYIHWTFRRAKKFFDIVTWTGNGALGRQIPHGLGAAPGVIVVKRTDIAGAWVVYHRALGATKYMQLNSTMAAGTSNVYWNDTEPTDSAFTIWANADVNASGGTYVAYLWAHDPSADGIIQCGNFAWTSGVEVNLGWEPQFVLFKSAVSTTDWLMFDTARGLDLSSSDKILYPNTSGAESSQSILEPTSTGFKLASSSSGANSVYIAIRKGLMRQPADATKVFSVVARSGTSAAVTVSAPSITKGVDLALIKIRNTTGAPTWMDRTRGTGVLQQSHVAAADTGTSFVAVTSFNMTGVDLGYSGTLANATGGNYINYFFKQARGFFDIVPFNGTGALRTLSHNLGVVPELMIFKAQDAAENWAVYYGDPTKFMRLNLSNAAASDSTFWNNTAPTDKLITLGSQSEVNRTGRLVAYLFASCPGVSKIGTYTGTDAAINIDCGFAAGARFVLIKRISASDGWTLFDTARGIVSGTDPWLVLNGGDSEYNGDYVDPYSPGFSVTSTLSILGQSYFYLAIA